VGRCIGLDIHRDFCEVAIWQDGTVRRAPRVAARPKPLEQFAQQLGPEDRVALEATGNALLIARIIRPHVRQVVIVNTRRLAAISDATPPRRPHPRAAAGGRDARGLLDP